MGWGPPTEDPPAAKFTPRIFGQSRGLVLFFVDHFASGDPRHHGAQGCADFFDLVFVVDATGGFEAGLANGVFEHEIAHEDTPLSLQAAPRPQNQDSGLR